MAIQPHRHSNNSRSQLGVDSLAAFLSDWAEAEGSPAQIRRPSHSQHHRLFSLLPPDIPIPSGALRRRNTRFSYDYDNGHGHLNISNDGSSLLSHEEEQNQSRLSENDGIGNTSKSPSCIKTVWHRESVSVTGSGDGNGGIPSLPFDGRSHEQMTQTHQSPSTSRSGLAVTNSDHQQGSAVPSESFAPFRSSQRANRERRRSTI